MNILFDSRGRLTIQAESEEQDNAVFMVFRRLDQLERGECSTKDVNLAMDALIRTLLHTMH